MVELETTPETIQRIYKRYEDTVSDWRRPHLGASVIGHPCDRYKWFTFRWAAAPSFPGRLLRLFQTGHREEARVIQDLRDIGIEVYDKMPDSDDDTQIRYESWGGHYAGSLDGIGRGFPEAPVTWHVLEMKTMKTSVFQALSKSCVRDTMPQHYIQMQQYMAWSGLTRAYYFAVCKETDDIYGERVPEDPDMQSRIAINAEIVIFRDRPHPVDDRKFGPTTFECRYCQFRPICWENGCMEHNCRTCMYSRPDRDGLWVCRKKDAYLSTEHQKEGCDDHDQIDIRSDIL